MSFLWSKTDSAPNTGSSPASAPAAAPTEPLSVQMAKNVIKYREQRKKQLQDIATLQYYPITVAAIKKYADMGLIGVNCLFRPTRSLNSLTAAEIIATSFPSTIIAGSIAEPRITTDTSTTSNNEYTVDEFLGEGDVGGWLERGLLDTFTDMLRRDGFLVKRIPSGPVPVDYSSNDERLCDVNFPGLYVSWKQQVDALVSGAAATTTAAAATEPTTPSVVPANSDSAQDDTTGTVDP